MHNKNKITLLNIASTIVLQGLAFFSGPIFSGVLGTSNYGIAAVYLTWVQIASTVFSLRAGGTVAIARSNFPMEDQNKFQSSTLSLATFSFAVFSLLTMAFTAMTAGTFSFNIGMIALGLVQAWGMYCVTFMNAKLTYEFKADKNFILSVLTSGLTIGASIFLIKRFPVEDNYWGRIIGQAVVYGVIGIVLYFGILLRGRTFYSREYWMFTLPITIPTIFHTLAHIVLNQSDKVMIQGMLNNSSAGIYALAATFGAVMNSVWHAMNNSWVPFYYEYTRQNQIDKMKKHAKNYNELFTIITMGFILLTREVFNLYAPDSEFLMGTDYIPLFTIGYYFVFLYSFPVNYEFYYKKTNSIALGTIVAAVLNIVLNYIMINFWGTIGAVTATAISHGFLFFFHYLIAKKMKEAEFPFAMIDFVPGFCAVCGTVIVYWVTKELWFVRWLLACALGVYIIAKIFKRKEIF